MNIHQIIIAGIGLFGLGVLVGIGLCMLDNKSKGMVCSSYHPSIILKEENNG